MKSFLPQVTEGFLGSLDYNAFRLNVEYLKPNISQELIETNFTISPLEKRRKNTLPVYGEGEPSGVRFVWLPLSQSLGKERHFDLNLSFCKHDKAFLIAKYSKTHLYKISRTQDGNRADSCICTNQESSHTDFCTLHYPRRTHLYL